MLLVLIGIQTFITILFSFAIVRTWKLYNDDGIFPLYLSLRRYAILSPIWPTDNRFRGLHFSIIRHYIVTLVSLLLIWYINLRWLNSVLLSLNAMYAVIKIPVQKARIQDWKNNINNERSGIVELLTPLKRLCTTIFFYPFILWIFLMVGYGLRPQLCLLFSITCF